MSTPKSMTGFGRAEGEWRGGKITVETKSVNHRFLELKIKLPSQLSPIEQYATEWVRGRVSRGRVDVFVSVRGVSEMAVMPSLNMPLALKYAEFFKQLSERLGSSDAPNPALILKLPDVILMQEDPLNAESEWNSILPVFEKAFGALEKSALSEGAKLAEDVVGRLQRVGELATKIAEMQPQHLRDYRARLATRIQQLTDKPDIDEDRLAQELAYYAERCDFTEESVRLKSHIERFGEILNGAGARGRSLDFLTQEMLREINTAASKALSAGISQMAVEVKAELEKIREQIQNIE